MATLTTWFATYLLGSLWKLQQQQQQTTNNNNNKQQQQQQQQQDTEGKTKVRTHPNTSTGKLFLTNCDNRFTGMEKSSEVATDVQW